MDSGSVSRRVSATAADGKKTFIDKLKSEFLNSPLASNVVLGLILTGLEKAVEVEFACPCDPKWNALFTAAYFILPGVAVSVLMLVIKGIISCKCNICQEGDPSCSYECKICKEWKNFIYGLVPIIIWLVLVFLDGQYFACANTNWSGRYIIVDKAEPQRWCEPANGTSYMERMSLTQRWYFHSQVIGFAILFGCLVSLGIVICCIWLYNRWCKQKKKARSPEDPEDPDQIL
ncbi:uncharacterized protein LOC114857894 [Betta splendens]|uniref:Uncharacterized protein LOC114857894 n=1 Tax=Betta splendens TaxID=158456 RepID=A0A6P7MWC5_BETSP|nr:uncharacterized protein LOC114857894 [Betta splendens]